jgi:alanyl-tRNA synthetase
MGFPYHVSIIQTYLPMENSQMTSREIREQFLRFFEERGHHNVPSSPVVPANDPTLLFANAGMNQFKDVFLGTGSRPYKRAVNTQKCIRAGGKHNDLEDVGQDTYHHTFFEMLGNWSFGDYFKKEAIAWAWELLTEVFGIPPDRLHLTYFEGDRREHLEPDLEARDLWAAMPGVRPENIHPGTKKDNFWEMAETGPCGPCSEIHVDLTPDKVGGTLVNANDPRVFEIWNLVFIQFNRGDDGKLRPLPAKHVDTGMGFERLVTVLQGKQNNYETDLFQPLLTAIQQLTQAPPYQGTLPTPTPSEVEYRDVAYRVVADHLRCLTFAIADGGVPDKEGRGYVIRRILRRAYRYGRQYLGVHGPFLHRLVPVLVEQMGDVFPEIREHASRVREVIHEEEQAFARTLDNGIKLFTATADEIQQAGQDQISGEVAFKLHDTYGFPIDLTELMARERGLHVDREGYDRAREEAIQKAREGGKGDTTGGATALVHALAVVDPAELRDTETDDQAKYTATELTTTMRGWVDAQGEFHTSPLDQDVPCAVVLDRTCFYAEQGGQVGDTGSLVSATGRFEVLDTRRFKGLVLHFGQLTSGSLKPGEVRCTINGERRGRIVKNHTATHLLNLGLREVLGEHVQQKGSLVDDDKTRFDFSHPGALNPEEVEKIEELINAQVSQDLAVHAADVPYDEALTIEGIRAVFGEKYPEVVRVIAIGPDIARLRTKAGSREWRAYSVELCGGTHLPSTGPIQHFTLIAEEPVGAGVRRVVGITAQSAQEAETRGKELVASARALLASATPKEGQSSGTLQAEMGQSVLPLRDRVRLRQLIAELQKQEKARDKETARSDNARILEEVAALHATSALTGGVTVTVGTLNNASVDQLRLAADWLRNKAKSSASVLLSENDGRVSLLVMISKDVVSRGIQANQLIREVAPVVGGSGGGRPDMAQGGGRDPEKIPDALARARAWLSTRLA